MHNMHNVRMIQHTRQRMIAPPSKNGAHARRRRSVLGGCCGWRCKICKPITGSRGLFQSAPDLIALLLPEGGTGVPSRSPDQPFVQLEAQMQRKPGFKLRLLAKIA